MIPYKVFSHFSIGMAFGKPDEYVKEATERNLPAIALTDMNSVSGVVEFLQLMEKSKILPIVGSYVTTPQGCILLLCKNRKGWVNLVKILGRGTTENSAFMVSLDTILDYSDDLIAIAGGHDSISAGLIRDRLLGGKFRGDIAVSIETDDDEVRRHEYREVAVEFGLHVLSTTPVFYVKDDDKICQEIMQCSRLKITLADAKPPEIQRFFDNTYALSSLQADNSSDWLLSKIEKFSVSSPPLIPACKDENGKDITNPDEVLRKLCQEGWKIKGLSNLKKTDPALFEVYSSRIREELDVFVQAKISNYILLVRDFINFTRQQGFHCGPRGSAGGCLISYLLGITTVDPVRPDPTLKYSHGRELIFSRFINKGRFLGGKNSLPDIDCDVPINARHLVIKYLKEKYGTSCVGHIVTFNRLDGRGAIKEVFRVTDPVANSHDVADAITKNMPDKAKIQDDLEDLKNKHGHYTTVHYALDFIPAVSQYLDEYTREFDLAKRMTDTISHTGQHAAGIVVANQPLCDLFPTIINQKTNELMVNLEMADAEYVGCVKFDLLGVSAYEKLGIILHMINQELEEVPLCTTNLMMANT